MSLTFGWSACVVDSTVDDPRQPLLLRKPNKCLSIFSSPNQENHSGLRLMLHTKIRSSCSPLLQYLVIPKLEPLFAPRQQPMGPAAISANVQESIRWGRELLLPAIASGRDLLRRTETALGLALLHFQHPLISTLLLRSITSKIEAQSLLLLGLRDSILSYPVSR